MKNRSIYNKIFFSMVLSIFLLAGCGSNNKNISARIDEILDKETITTADIATAYDLVMKLHNDDEEQATVYLQELKYCLYEADAYGLANDETIWGHTAEEAEERLKGNYYGTWHDQETDKEFAFTSETINGRAYYVRSVYTDYSIMLIYGYLDEPEKLYCLEIDAQYCTYLNGNSDLVLYVNYNKDYVSGLSYINTSWCNFDKLTHNAILNAYEEYLQSAQYGTSDFQIYEGNISNRVVPSYEDAKTTEIEGDGTYFDEIVSGAWFDEYGQPIATYMPKDLTEKFFFNGYYAELRHLHFVDASNVTLDYVKRYGYSTDVVFDEIYALVITDIYKMETENGKNYFQGTEYYSGEPVVIWGEFSGLLNGDSVMVIGPFNGLATDDTANFTGVWCELINNRFGENTSYGTGYSEWWEDDIGNHGTSDVYDDYYTHDSSDKYDTNAYDMCDYLYGVKGTPEDFFNDIGLSCYTSIEADGMTLIRISEDDYSVLFRKHENIGESRYSCAIQNYMEGVDKLNIEIAGFNVSMSYEEVIQMLDGGNWNYVIEGEFISATQGDSNLFFSFYEGTIFGIEYRKK